MRRSLAVSAVMTTAALCAVVWTVQPASAAPARALFASTTTTLSASPNPAQTTDAITLTATVTSSSGTPTGTVTFYEGDVALGTSTVNGSGVATFTGLTISTAGSYSLTASYEDPTFVSFAPSQGSTTLTVGSAGPTQYPTTVTLSASSTSVQTGQSATLTATVSSSGGGTPTGSVEFYDNGNDLGGAALNGSGVASLSSSGFLSGTNAITATYAGDSTHKSASSGTVNITATTPVTVYGTSTSLSANPTSITAGASATFTATVTSNGGGTPTGSVQFYDNDVPIGNSVTLDSSGSASLTWTGFTSGTHDVTAKYQGDSTHHVSTSSQASVTATAPVFAVATTITSSISPNPIPGGGSATLTAHVQQVGTQVTPPQGSIVTFRNAANGALIGQATLDSSGNGSVVTYGWQPGSYKITATYVGDASDASSSASIPVTVRPVTPLTVTAPSPTIVYGNALPTLTPTYSGFVNGETASSLTTQPTCTTNATGTSPAAGSYAVNCSGASDIYYSFTYVPGTMTVSKAPLTITPNNLTMTQGNPLPSLTATISGFVNGETLVTSDVTGSPSCTTTATSASPAGTYPITCTVGSLSSSNYSFSVVGQGVLTISVTGVTATTSIAWVGGPILVGHPVTLVGSLFSHWGALQGETMTLSLGSFSCTATTNWAGFATCTVTPTSPLGPTLSTASFAGDATYAASTGSRNAILYALPNGGGAFVIGDKSASTSKTVTFWSSQWSKDNSLSGGDAPSDFKGFASSPATPTIGSTWSAGAGSSSSPPSSIPAYMGVIVTGSATKSHSTTSGTVCNIAVVDTTGSNYGTNPGHDGTGTIVGSLFALAPCSSDHGSNGSGDSGNGNSGGDNGHGNSNTGGYTGYGSNGSNSPNDYTNHYGGGYSADSHRSQWGYATCPAL